MSRSTSINSWESWEDDEEGNLDLALFEELNNTIFEIDQQRFFKLFLAGKPGDLALECWDALKDPNSISFKNTIESQITAELDALKQEKEAEKEKEVEKEAEKEAEKGKKTEKKKKEEKETKREKETKHPDADGLGDDATEDVIRNAIRDAIRNAIWSRLPTYDTHTEQFPLLVNVGREGGLYKPLASLLTFINYFSRNFLENEDGVDRIDKAWPKAVQTWPLVDAGSEGAFSTQSDPPSANGSTRYLRRRFVEVRTIPRYTRPQDGDFKPDLALVLQRSENPRPPNPLGWKDIKVAIEVKPRIETPHRQTARYARCMKLEQFDRNFFFTLTITGTEFRIARWDSAACYITPSVDFHKDPLSFIHVVGQLACMSPEQLGYDNTFSNAGRVLHSESTISNCGIRTILTITPCEVVEDLQKSEDGDEAEAKNEDEDKGQGEEEEGEDEAEEDDDEAEGDDEEEDEGGDGDGDEEKDEEGADEEEEEEDDLRESSNTPPDSPIKKSFQYLLDDELLCDARDLLFCRSTRVWKAQLITESGQLSPPNVIKQNWHDEDRINEAWFYEQTKDITHGVAHMIAFQDLHRTRGTSSLIKSRHVRATWTLASKTKASLRREPYGRNAPALKNLCHRVLVRFVLKEVGLPLSRIKTPRQLVHVIRDIALALEALYDRDILHRDISEGNILLSSDENAAPGNRAFLTDFGLAMRIDRKTKRPLPSSVKHDHMTGTLPFIATIFHGADEGYTPLCMIHHDVESLFWVAMYTLFRFASCEASENMSVREKGAIVKCRGHLNALRSSNIETLESKKRVILGFPRDFELPGRWSSIRGFLSKVASVCAAKFEAELEAREMYDNPDPLNHELRVIVSAADSLQGDSSVRLDDDAPPPLPRPSPQSTPQSLGQSERTVSTSTSKKSKRRREDDRASYSGRIGDLSGNREHSKRKRTGGNREGSEEF